MVKIVDKIHILGIFSRIIYKKKRKKYWNIHFKNQCKGELKYLINKNDWKWPFISYLVSLSLYQKICYFYDRFYFTWLSKFSCCISVAEKRIEENGKVMLWVGRWLSSSGIGGGHCHCNGAFYYMYTTTISQESCYLPLLWVMLCAL